MKHRVRASSQLIRVIDPYLPPSFRENTNLSLEDLIRARVLTAIILSAIGGILFTIMVLAISYMASGENFSNALIIATICLLVVGLDFLFFYKSGRLDASATLFSLTLFLSAVICTILTGGFDSPVRNMLICIPVVVFLVGGRQEGFYNAALCYVVGIVLLLLKLFDFPMQQIMPEPVLPYLTGIIWLLVFVLIVVCLYVYDVLLEETRDTVVHPDITSES